MDAMTVGELIDYLSKFDKNLPVMSNDPEETGGFIGVTSVVAGYPVMEVKRVYEIVGINTTWFSDMISPEETKFREFDAVVVRW